MYTKEHQMQLNIYLRMMPNEEVIYTHIHTNILLCSLLFVINKKEKKEEEKEDLLKILTLHLWDFGVLYYS